MPLAKKTTPSTVPAITASLDNFKLFHYTKTMNWNYSIGWLFVGILILAIGTAITVFYQKISDTWASGPASYERVKLIGIIVAVIGLIVMANLHTLILSACTSLIFKQPLK